MPGQSDGLHEGVSRIRWSSGSAQVTGLRDLSKRGVFIATDAELELGLEVVLELYDAHQTAVAQGVARVVWAQPGQGVALEFLDLELSPDQLSRLTRSMTDSGAARPGAAHVETKVRHARPSVTTLAIGIDLGTSNTCASAVLKGKPQVIPTRFGDNTVPSVLTVGDEREIIVGEIARRRMVLRPECTVYGSKRLIGRIYRDDTAEYVQEHFAYPLVEVEGTYGALLRGNIMSMEEVAGHLLREVRQVAVTHLGMDVQHAVITVPAYFNELQRTAVRRAAKAAGLEVDRLVNEPTAAAIAYGYNQNSTARLAVFDLGGGTFDISILKVRGNEFQVVGTGGDAFLGGIDFDDLIAEELLHEFNRVEHTEVHPTPQQLARLREAAEDTKRGLSVQTRLTVSLPQFAKVDSTIKDLHVPIERARVETLANELFVRMFDIVEEVLEECGLTAQSIDDVLLVGGATRMPLVQQKVQEFFGQPPSKRVNPDEAVAIGAALLASEAEVDDPLELIDVLPLSIGTAGEGRRMQRLIPRNAPIPTKRSFVVSTTRNGQDTHATPLFQGENDDAAGNEYLGTLLIERIPPGEAGSRRYELTLLLDEQCQLQVRAHEQSTGTECPVRLDRSRSLAQVARELGPYAGRKAAQRQRPTSALGRILRRFRRLLSA